VYVPETASDWWRLISFDEIENKVRLKMEKQ